MRGAVLAALVALLPRAQATGSEPPAPGHVSCQDRSSEAARARGGARSRGDARATAPDPQARRELEAAWRRWDEEANTYRAEVQATVRERFEERRALVAASHDQVIGRLERLERDERAAAIARFEQFLARAPDDPRITPGAMFRLAELHYEEANDAFEQATREHREQARRALAEGRDPPPEPLKSYARSIALYQQLITGFPDHEFAHAMYYLLAYCLAEMGQGAEAQAAYRTLIERYPRSPFVPEAWVRLGDWHFDDAGEGALERAADAFSRMYAFPDHPLFARAVYKLGWTYYRMDDFERAVETFGRLLDHYVARSRRTGEAPSGDVWPEAIQYMAVSLADDARGGGIERARAYFAARGRRPYEAELYAKLGEVWLEQTRHPLAAAAFEEALAAAPLAPEAPQLQARIALAWSRDGQPDREVAAREALVRAYSEGTAWWTRNAGDPGLLATVTELVETSLLRAASHHHARAQALRVAGAVDASIAAYRTAARAYGEALARSPRSKRAYDLAYARADCLFNANELDAAARAYAAVRDDPADDRHEAEAALSAVIAREREVARLRLDGRLPERKVLLSAQRGEREVKEEPLPAVLSALVRDSDVLVARFPGHEQAPAVAYKAGEIFYAHGQLAEARCRLEEVAARWPGTEVARFAANLVIESHLATRDWAAVEEVSGRLRASQVAREPKLRASLRSFELGGRFNRALQLMEAGGWDEAAPLFLSVVADDPAHEFADEALYDAATCHERARRFERALALYERLSVEYPDAPLADEALFRVGYNAENAFDFEKAVDRYLALVERYPRSRHRKDALFNAARSLENLQRYGQAASAFARYSALHPDAEDAARTLFHAARVYEKMGDRRREIEALQELVGRFSRSREPELLVEAHLALGLAHGVLGDEAAARASYEAAVTAFAARGLRPEGSPRAAAAAAEARFRLAEYDLERYERMGLPATTETKRLKQALEAKLAEARKVAPQYDEVLRYKRPDWIIAASYRKAFLLERLARTILDAPVPPEFAGKGSEEYLAAYQDALARAAQPYEEQAVAVYVQAIDAARKLHVKNEWTTRIAESLARYRPREYPLRREPRARLLEDDLSPSRLPDGPSRRSPPAATR